MSAALGITVSYDDEFLPVEAFCFQSGAPVGLISAIDPFRYDALDTMLARQPVEFLAMSDLVVVILQRFRRAS